MNSLRSLKEQFVREGILIAFNGAFTHNIIEEIGNAAKRHMEHRQLTRNIITDVFAVYIEQTQNVRNYMLRQGLGGGVYDSAIVIISSNAEQYFVASGNPVRQADKAELQERLDFLNRQDKDALKQLYKQQLRKPKDDSALGAGLGLIDMARRSCGPLSYSFEELDDSFVFFTLNVTIAEA
ncbi:MAG: SiaB family protein kinase [Spirochaetes bacterium]|nr:SiaB family protein kinase [Spirochaetota bacterium]MBU0957016.1 SiaB family protein kinase [Spirochaetota bacterium]